MKKAFLMIELMVVMVGISILIQVLGYVYGSIKGSEAYAFIKIDEHCEVVCALEKLMP